MVLNSLVKKSFVLGLVLAVGALSGCALPGYNSGAMDGEHWYDFDHNDRATYDDKLADEQVIDYKPRVVDITPSLIVHQKSERKQEQLDPAVMALTRRPESVAYTVGRGDILRVTVYDHPELTNPGGTSGSDSTKGQLVSAEGNIYYPYVGEIHVAGLTLEQIRKMLTRRLSAYIRAPQLSVRVDEYRSQRVYISGDIVRPCTVPVTDISLTIVQALGECNSLARQNDKEANSVGVRNVRLIRDGKSTLINLNKVYAAGREIPLHSGDRLLVDDTANRVFMVGEFDHQKALPYTTGGMSLSDAIADAGGISLGTANTGAIYVIRGFVSGRDEVNGGVKTTMRPNIYHLDMSGPSGMLLANEFRLEPRDVVFSAPASLVNFNRALALLTPSLNQLFHTIQTIYLFERY